MATYERRGYLVRYVIGNKFSSDNFWHERRCGLTHVLIVSRRVCAPLAGVDGASGGLSGVPSEGPWPCVPAYLRHRHRPCLRPSVGKLTTHFIEVRIAKKVLMLLIVGTSSFEYMKPRLVFMRKWRRTLGETDVPLFSVRHVAREGGIPTLATAP